jgi:hypothetical protein
MGYFYRFGFGANAGSGTVGHIFPQPINFSEVFDGAPQFYSGSTIELLEVLTINSQVVPNQAYLVDIDYRWFDPKVYLGTYQLGALVIDGLETEAEGGQGYLTNYISKIKRYSRYTVTADPGTPIGQGDVLSLDNCNFGLKSVSLSVGPLTIEGSVPIQNQSLLTGYISRQRAPLKNAIYNQFFKSVGLYFNPGCEPLSVTHEVKVINAITTDYNPYPTVPCVPLGE